ncbi:MFS transporter [Microbulbifer sp. TRSA002]|uniref:MFS transporter n=1 Tax=Microbulbifer sp. TRSA002 TaxID=3243382 RepID=UPI004039D37D
MGQGLLFPIINELVMSTKFQFLPTDTPQSTRHLYYGVVISSFFLAWFIGSVYIAKLSDSIGRKTAMVLCLVGAMAGYAITVLSLLSNSLWLLILGQVISGFTTGNQPIVQVVIIKVINGFKRSNRTLEVLNPQITVSLFGFSVLLKSIIKPKYYPCANGIIFTLQSLK